MIECLVGVVVAWNAVVVQAVAATAARRRRPISVPVGVPSAVGFEVSLIDRYAIRTRNLQDWNLTRCRCANRSSKVSAREDAAAVRLEGDLAQAASAGYRGAALRWLLLPRQKEVVRKSLTCSCAR